MRASILTIALALVMANGAAAQSVEKARLRQLARLPTITFDFGFYYSSTRGFLIGAAKPDVNAEIRELRQTLNGDRRDALRYFQLGKLYEEAKDSARAAKAYARSVALYRQQIRSRPRDGRLLAQFGKALSAAGRQAEAETTLRRAVKITPAHWEGWAALGKFLTDRAWLALWGGQAGSWKPEAGSDYRNLTAPVLPHTPSSKDIAQAQKLLDEARVCFDKAVAVSPQAPEPYTERANFRAFGQNLLQSILREINAGNRSLADVLQSLSLRLPYEMLTPDAVSDFRQAARLSPNDFRAITTAVLVEMYAFIAHHGMSSSSEGDVWSTLSPHIKQVIRAAMSRLERITHQRDRRKVVGAAESLGFLQFIAGDTRRAERSLRRALTLAPSDTHIWELLTGVMVESGRYKALTPLLIKRLKHRETVRDRLLLARVYVRSRQFKKAEEQVQAALKREPGDFMANLTLAALLLRRSEDETALQQAGERLIKAGVALNNTRTHVNLPDYLLLRGIYLALTGDLEGARLLLEQVLGYNKADKEAGEALEVLEALSRGTQRAEMEDNTSRGGDTWWMNLPAVPGNSTKSAFSTMFSSGRLAYNALSTNRRHRITQASADGYP